MNYRGVITARIALISAFRARILSARNTDAELQVNIKLTQTEGECVLLKLTRLLWILLLAGAFVALGHDPAEADSGLASWYGGGFRGSLTASGEGFDPNGYTAAHKTLPFGTQLTVRYAGRSVQVTVNDRAHYTGGRELDLSRAAAQSLGLTSAGVGWANYTPTDTGGYRAAHSAGYRADNPATHWRDSSGHRYASERPDATGGAFYVGGPGGNPSGEAGPVR